MRVVGEQRLPGGCVSATHNPVVATKALANLVL